ncbi:MAG TPA: hypothetical protein EYP59_20535 [Thiotrichaceae bacterium]|nr:hypothetical protein [Thiotrichaceae bacterium]
MDVQFYSFVQKIVHLFKKEVILCRTIQIVNNTSSEKKRNAVRLGGGSIFATLIGTFGYFGSYAIDFLDRQRENNNRLVVLERVESEMVKGARFI